MASVMTSVGKKLKKFRIAADLSMEELSSLSGVGQSTISSIERDAQSPRIETLALLCVPLKKN
ncbi:helix-turn-helix domain-containing protein [Paenibacillus sp. IITD108]|uniref:helix-turn-helix domain-containing protein n=1 Tax=Paenibacillus sp. IITD108 TaxID=3116649 RepID=UPI002F408C10